MFRRSRYVSPTLNAEGPESDLRPFLLGSNRHLAR